MTQTKLTQQDRFLIDQLIEGTQSLNKTAVSLAQTCREIFETKKLVDRIEQKLDIIISYISNKEEDINGK